MPISGSAPYKEDLLEWYRQVRRDLPWRRTGDPYAIWVSEIMLQQTQVAAVLPYYERWMARYPTVEALAQSDEQEALALWQGLGYYRRCRLLREGARTLLENGMPANAHEWEKVPGVGRYTAGAIASIALNEPVPLVDGNVERVFARVKGRAATGPELKLAAWQWATDVLDHEHPGDWNQALMELGATVCKPAQPECRRCPIKGWCYAYETMSQDRLPVRPPKLKTVPVFHACWIPFCEGRFGVEQIAGGDWWQGMWQFPRVVYQPGEEPFPPFGLDQEWAEELKLIRHQVTIHRVTLRAFLVRLPRPLEGLRWETPESLGALPMPSPQRKALRLALECLGLS